MSYFLWVEVEGFYASYYDLPDQPLIVARDKRVLDANALAKSRGIQLGMEVRQAKSVVSDCVVKNWEPEDHVFRRNAWLDVCTDYTGIIEPIDQHIAALDLSGHPNPFDVTDRLVRHLVKQTGLQIRYGAAPSVWVARLAADRHDIGCAIESPRLFLSLLPVEDLLPALPEHRNRLSFLGYHTIGDVAEIPLSTLQAQFGVEGHIIHAAAQGKHFQPVYAMYPLDSIHESLIFDGLVELQETIENGYRILAEKIGRRLTDKGLQGSKLKIRVETEKGAFIKERRFTKPLHNPLSVLIAERLLLKDVLDEPVGGIHLSLADLTLTKHRQQQLAGLSTLMERSDAEAAIGYVRTVFGDESIKLGSQIELPRRVRVLKEWQNATGWR